MKLKVFSFFLFAIAITACRNQNALYDEIGIEKERQADAILKKVGAQLKREAGLRPTGTMGRMLYQIEILGLSFYYNKSIDIAEGRRLLIKATNALMDAVNEENKIHPYLCYYPFQPKNIQINVFLCTPDGREVPQGNLWIIRAEEGVFSYKIDHPITHRLITVYKETYEQALERIADPSLPLVSFEPDQEISQEELARLRKGISFVADDGSIWHLNEMSFGSSLLSEN